jgi:ethanolamine ammonia-lyase small subunit
MSGPTPPPPLPADPWRRLRAATRARVGLERSGDALPTAALLDLQAAHAAARDAVHQPLDFDALARDLTAAQPHPVIRVRSAAVDRASYIRRPDLGRRLDADSRARLAGLGAGTDYDVVFIIADGLSSQAVARYAVATVTAALGRLAGWHVAPLVLAAEARVALADEIGALLGARQSVITIGERPGLSVADSLGLYLTWEPRPGRRDSERNCVSNIHRHGLSPAAAAATLAQLMGEARRLGLSGVALKEPDAIPGLTAPQQEAPHHD